MSGLKERLAKLSPEQRRKLLEKLAAREGGGAQTTPPSAGEESKAAASSAEAQEAGTPGAAAQDAVAQEAVAPETAAATTIIPRAPRDGSPLPVSFAQQRLWFLDQMQPGNPFYNVPSALRFQGRLRPAALALTLSALSLRQEALRVRFPARDGQPVQLVAEAAAVPLPTVDLSALEPKRRIATALALTAAEARAPFHLARGPLARFRLLRLSAEDHVLLLNFHHIIADGWSLGVLVKELETLYASAYHGERESGESAGDVTGAIAAIASTLPPLPVQYADFAVWQRRELGGGELERQLGYWREKLADLPTLDLPKDRPRPVFQRFRGRRHELRVSASVLEALESRWTGGEQTLFMVLLAAFSSFLARTTHQRDIVVGSPIANRGQRELEALVGFFVNSLVLRSDLSGDPTFHAAAEGARAVALEAYDHQDVPFEKLVEELQPERHLASNPLFQVVLALQNAPVGRLELPEVEVSLFGADGEVTCRFDLQLDLWPGDGADEGALVGALQYDVDLFDATTIARLGEAFLTLLAGAAEQPRTPISQLPLLDQAQRQQLVEIGAAREVPTAPGGDEALAESPNLWARFLTVARRQPESVAVRCEERSLTYGQLATRALALGRRLVAQGVQPEDRVGLALERSEALVEALLGILAAGAAYLPLDPDYPQERLAYLLEDSGAAAVITRRGLLESLPPLGETPAVLIDQLEGDSGTADTSFREDGLPSVGRDHAAYVIYTSGTTGRPKGVLIPHGRVQRLFDISQPYFHFGPQDVWTLFHSVSFDFSVWELWGALAYGGELVVVPYLTSRSPEAFLELLEERRVTVLNQTPSAFLALDRADADGRRSAVLALRWVVFGGEALDVATLAPWYRDRGNDAQLVNMYGITETTVHVTYQLLRPEDARPSSQDGVPENTGAIGRPLEDLSHQVLDSEGRLLPLGVPGELQVGGAGVARGYLGRPALTADRFRPDPLGATPGARLYRTGDLVRHRGDGSLVYLGRIDHQVKVRGFRIELGEIEAALTAHPAVARSLVMLRPGEDGSGAQSGDENLVAYVVQARGLGGDERDQVGQWNEVFDETYGRGERFEEESPDFNISGWDSHVTGGEIPAPEMGRWLEDTLEGIEARLQGLASPQRRVLEIGCGTGMILFRVAPDCDRYVGTDLSAEALAYVERHLGDELSPRVELLERPGTDFSALQTASFDAVVINSVIQYFPSGEYLERVITRAVDVLAPGGFLFLGDLRSLPLLDVFHVAAEVHRAQREGEPELSRKDLARRVDLARMQENELVLDPALFFQLAQRLPRVSRLEIVPKGSRDRNELSLFRYQAILHIASEEGVGGAAESASVEPATVAPTWLDWRGQQLVQGDDLRALESWMQSPRGPAADVAVALAAVPEGRLTEVLALQQLLWDESEAGEATVLDLAATAATTAAAGPEVEDWLRLGRDLGRRVDLSWARHEGGALDVVLSPEGAPPPSLPAPEERRGALYNEPLLGAFARRVVPELRGWLEDRLPVFMVPNHFVLLAEFPRTPNGKIDRRGLPAPEKVRGEPASTFVAPRTATEELVAEVFAEVLAIDGVGAEDDFFALGGHSLLATRAVARLRERSGQDLALRSLFETSTVEELAQRLDAGGGTAVPEVDAAQRAVGSSLDSSLGSSMAGGASAREAQGGASPALGLRSAPPLVPVPRDRPLPLSFAQERLWFLSQLDADSSVYNELMEVPFHGPRDLRSLHRALEDLVSRHEILRTTYAEVDGRPVQQIAVAGSSFARPALPVVDLRGLPTERRGRLAAQLADRLRRRPFDLRRDLPLRPLLTLLEDRPEARDDARRHLAVCLHHIVVDGWSSGLLRRDMESLYEARRRGVSSPLPPPALHYADFAAWQRRWFRGPVLEAQLDFWRQRLRDLEPLELPGDRPRPTVVSGAAALASRRWDRLTTARLRRAASGVGGTLFMLLGAAFGAVVARMAGAEEAVFGTPVANRRRRELESVVGFFVNLLVLRFPVRRESGFQGLLEDVKERALEAFEAQDLPLEKLVEELAPDRDLSRNPFFQLCFQVLQSATAAPGRGSEEPARNASPEAGSEGDSEASSAAPTLEDVAVGAKFDLHLAVVDEGETLISVLEYRPELYDASTAARLLQSLEVFTLAALESVSRGEDRPLAALPLTTDAQRHQLLAEWSGAGRSTSFALGIEELDAQPQDLWSAFSAAAAEHGESPALGWGESWWSYGEVKARAQVLAVRLAAGGVGPGARVGLALERSPQLVVAMLATLRLGAAYVPLDPAFPPSRLELMAADAHLAAVCADAAGAAAVPTVAGEGSSLPVLRLDLLGEGTGEDAAAALPPLGAAACAEALAYVLYTSGSTGRPKGVAVPHGAVLRLVQRGACWHDFGPHRTYLFHSPAAFDASTFEIWGALVHGARLAVLPAGPAGSEEVVRGAVAAGVDTLWLTAALFHRAVEEQGEELASIATVLAGGDVLDPLAVARFRELAADSGARLVNGYGPTENTTFTCCWRSPRWTDGDAAARGSLAPVPVGHPVDGTFVAVVDRQLRPLPAGAVGELVTGGAGLAWGYVDQPARSAEVFVPDALSGAFGGRLYRTGDGARWHGEGSIDFLGRRDRQVKVRGHRVELGEVEAQLRTLPGVGEAVVAARPVSQNGAGSELRLVAWVGGSGEEAVAPDVAALRSALRRLLPEAFVPEAFVPLDRLPLTPAGKVDRRALPSVEAAVAPAAGAEAPRSAEEEIVAGVLAQVLERPRVGVEDDFFELGGHSLLATRAVGRLRQAFEVELPLSALFESPTPRALAARLVALRRGAGAEAPPLRPREDSAASAPLSFAQERLWFLDQLEPGSVFYNMPHPVRLRGPLDPGALARALATVVERHQVLRSAFPAAAAATPVQRVLAAPGLELLPAVDLSGLPPEVAAAEAHRLAAAEAARPFALDRGPLLRAALVRLPEGADASSAEAQDHVLLLTVHHAASDGWSTGLLLTELRTAYDGWRRGEAPTLAPLPVQYGDFAAWQRGWLEGERLEAQLDFWRRTLADHPMVLELPADRRRPAAPTFRGARHTLHLPAAEGLVAWGRGQGATAFMTLLAAFGATLGRLAVDDEPILGTPVANRPRAELESLIGFFVNSLPLRLSLQGDPSFATLVDRVRSLTLDAFAHQDVPFESLVEALRPARDLSRTPIFQVMFALQELPPGEELGLGEASLEAMAYGRDTVLFDLNLDLMAFEDGSFGGALELSLDLFDVSTAARLASSFRELVAGAAAAPETPVSQLRLLTAGQRHQLLLEDPGRRIFPGVASSLSEILWSERFAAAVEDRGEAAALIHGEGSFSFRELAAGATAVAAHLIQRVGPLNGEAPVGLAAGRSLPAAAALLGILEAGAPFLTLDPSYPGSRLRGMVSDAGLCAVVVDAAGREALAAVADLGVPLLALEELTDPAALSAEAAAAAIAQRPPIHPQQAAYLFYTSGSTGRPKGAVIRHQAFSEYVEACASALDLGPQDRFLQFASWSFDVAVEELFPAWSAGAAVVLAEPAELEQPESFQRRLEESKITAVELPTAFWQEWTRSLVLEALSPPEALRFVIVGGERMQRERLRDWQQLQQRLPESRRCRLIHVYGLTETTVTSSFHHALPGREVPLSGGELPVGRPLDPVRVQVLDPHGEPCPPGVEGEVYIGGPLVGGGYRGRPARTAQSFVPDPYGAVFAAPGERLYRTGDRGRRLADGGLELLGRFDHQVKVRGFRVEPGEVEAALAALDGVAEAVVLLREDRPGDKRLVGYWTSPGSTAESSAAESPAAEIGEGDLRRLLGEQLPEHMVPSRLLRLDSLPLSPNGKVDRRALPAPEGRGELENPFIAPESAEEKALAALWSEVLGVEPIGLDDDFFGLGGHSLLATRLAAGIRRRFAVELPLRRLFEAPTVRQLAAVIAGSAAAPAGEAESGDIPLAPQGPAPLSFAQERLWFLEQLEGPSSLYNLPSSVRMRGALDRRALDRALSAIVRRHQALRTRFLATEALGDKTPAGEAAVYQLPLPSPHQVLRRVDLSGLDSELAAQELQRLAGQEARLPFDLASGELLRGVLVALSPDHHGLLFTVHHIASDAWSAGVLLQELGALYDAFRSLPEGASDGAPDEAIAAAVDPLPIQYSDFAAWQRQRLAGERLETELAFWRQRLDASAAPLELPADRPRPPLQTFRGAHQRAFFGEDLREPLGAVARERRATPFAVLGAAFALLLSKLSGRRDLHLGVPWAGREHPQTQGLIGFFVNTLVLALEVDPEASFLQLVDQVRERLLEAQSHGEVPFEKLVEALAPKRNLAHSPLFQVLLNLEAGTGAEGEAAATTLPGLALEPLGMEVGTAKYDLTLALTDDGERLAGALEHNLDLFDATTARRWIAALRQLLSAALERPEGALGALPLLSAAQRHQVLAEQGAAPAASPLLPGESALTLPQLLREAAQRWPAQPFLATPQGWLDRQTVWQRAQKVAAAVAALIASVPAEAPVAVLLERGPGALPVLIGLSLLGRPYVPLDPQHPAARLSLVLEDAGAVALVASDSVSLPAELQAHGDDLPQLVVDAGGRVLAESGEAASMEGAPAEGASEAGFQSSSLDPSTLLYVLYTSGSTGRPKGVEISHRAALAFLRGMAQPDAGGEPLLTPWDHLLSVTTLAFDISFLELFLPLVTGARLQVATAAQSADGEALAALLSSIAPASAQAASGRTVLQATPATWRLLLAVGWRPTAPFLALSGGEALPVPLAASLLEAGCQLRNLYGPTEATVWATSSALGAASRPVTAAAPLGRALPGYQTLVLDAVGEPVPAGVPGQLHLAGAALARGYRQRPALTAATFRPHGDRGDGERLYRTGDLVRRRPDGTLDFLGRIDHQLKLRGFRIESGEIEVVLEQQPAVRQAVVMLRLAPDAAEDSDPRLVAYVVAAQPGNLDEARRDALESSLRQSLGERLPAYMQPSAWVFLESLPLTPNGKVDRRALPQPEARRGAVGGQRVAPRNALERRLGALWAEVLGVPEVGRDDNFFELGGHSLLLVRLRQRLTEALGEELGREIPLVDLFRFPSVAALARHLAADLPERAPDAADARRRAAAKRQALEDRRRRRGPRGGRDPRRRR
ncbi:MAG: amino acid adenylation domain-containing protein [Acidobacteriota bacterium]